MLTAVAEEGARREDVSRLNEVVREGARRMPAAALEAEVDAYLAELAHGGTSGPAAGGPQANGHAQPSDVMTGAGRSRWSRRGSTTSARTETGQRKRFRSAILPRWCRKSPKIAEVLPLLYLHGSVHGWGWSSDWGRWPDG